MSGTSRPDRGFAVRKNYRICAHIDRLSKMSDRIFSAQIYCGQRQEVMKCRSKYVSIRTAKNRGF